MSAPVATRGWPLLLAAALLTGACARAREPQAAPPDVAIFDSRSIWDGDVGTTVTRAGFEHQAVYRFDSLAHRMTLPMGGACCIGGLAPSPRADRVAYATYGASPPLTDAQKAVTGVRVVAADNSEIAWFPGCDSPCWSADGTRLAMIESRAAADGSREPVAVRVTDRSGGSKSFPLEPQRMAWGNGDTLFLEYQDRVEALDVARGKSWRTAHVGCDVSPDGEYSFRYRGQSRPFQLRRRAGGVDLAYCVLNDVGVDPFNRRVLSPFWIRSSVRKHLLCFGIVTVATGTVVNQGGRISIMDPARSPPGQQGVNTVVFDPETFKVVYELSGKVVVPTMDHRSLVMLLGDTLSRVRLPEWPSEPPRPAIGRVRVQVYAWGSGASGPDRRLVRDSTCTVAAGDWLPGAGLSTCGDLIRVAGIREDSRLELHLPAGMFVDYVESDAGPHAARLLLGPAAVHLRTNSLDGGYDVFLTRVP